MASNGSDHTTETAPEEIILQYSPFIIPLLVSAAITGILALICLKRRNDPDTPPFILFMCATTWWALCYAVQLAHADLATQVLITTIEYPAIATAPAAWLLWSCSVIWATNISSPGGTLPPSSSSR